jgi:hypothetical protein
MSITLLASITPVTPPKLNRNIKPTAHIIGRLNFAFDPHIVPIQENTFTPVGIAIIIVTPVKYALASIFIPTVYI